MTADAAKLLGMETSLGAVAAGKAADIIAVPGNPLEDILVLRETAFVMKAGRVFRDDRP
jgi:imidazolonepropionase-like amidohydrolase